jgi:hypothetical protein
MEASSRCEKAALHPESEQVEELDGRGGFVLFGARISSLHPFA